MYWKYLKYVLRHKWYVSVECFKMGLIWRGICHDLSKFRPSEFIPYARFFYGSYPSLDDVHGDQRNLVTIWKEDVAMAFDFAWLLHQKRNDHHWQWWILPEDDGGTKIMPMPAEAIKPGRYKMTTEVIVENCFHARIGCGIKCRGLVYGFPKASVNRCLEGAVNSGATFQAVEEE